MGYENLNEGLLGYNNIESFFLGNIIKEDIRDGETDET